MILILWACCAFLAVLLFIVIDTINNKLDAILRRLGEDHD